MSSTIASSRGSAFATPSALSVRSAVVPGSTLRSARRAGRFSTAQVATAAVGAVSAPTPLPSAPRVRDRAATFGTSGRSKQAVNVETIATPVALSSHLRTHAASNDITVLSCHSKSCPGCRATMPKFYKLADAYAQTDACVNFVQMDYSSNDDFCHSILGVNSLPFFAVFKGTEYVSGSAIGWKSLTSKLTSQIESNLIPASSTTC